MKMKITKPQMLARFEAGAVVIPPLFVRSFETTAKTGSAGTDAHLELALPEGKEGFRFALESKSQSTPQSVQLAIAQARAAARSDELPMIQVPYLSPERLADLEKQGLSGVDLCGNGVVIVPDRLWIARSGQPNKYRDSRPLNNPYRGRSAMVARALLQEPSWPTLTRLVKWIGEQGTDLSLAQASKAIHALEEDLIVFRPGRAITLRERQGLLDKLGQGWKKPEISARGFLKLPQGRESIGRLSSVLSLNWSMTGESSAARYVTFSQGGPWRIAVSNMALATSRLEAVTETIPSFADIELLESEEPGYYFANVPDKDGVRWASRIQTWLELQDGDARQQEAARDLRQQLVGEPVP